MNTPINVQREYIIRGVVVERTTQRGVRGLRVDVWDRDTRYHDLLGQAVTDEDGAFTIAFDSVYFGDFAPDREPDVFFRVYLDQTEVLSTFDRPLHNLARGTTQVRLEVDLRQMRPLGKDRLNAEQSLKAIDCWNASDFRGVFRQGRDKTMTVGKMLGAVAGTSFNNMSCTPVQPKGTAEREIINQNQDTARIALAQQQVEVSEVKPIGAMTRGDAIKSVANYPVRLNPGDRVTLYEENGIVKYYTRDSAPATTADGQTIARIDGDVQTIKTRVSAVDDMRAELASVKAAHDDAVARAATETEITRAQTEELARVQQELDDVRQRSASKDAQITHLKEDLDNLRNAHDELAARSGADRIRALELAVRNLDPNFVAVAQPVATGLTRPGAVKRTGKAAKKTAAAKKPKKSAKKTSKKPRKPGPTE